MITSSRPLRLAIIGGGPSSWIGGQHRRAARFDACWQVLAEAFSSRVGRSRQALDTLAHLLTSNYDLRLMQERHLKIQSHPLRACGVEV